MPPLNGSTSLVLIDSARDPHASILFGGCGFWNGRCAVASAGCACCRPSWGFATQPRVIPSARSNCWPRTPREEGKSPPRAHRITLRSWGCFVSRCAAFGTPSRIAHRDSQRTPRTPLSRSLSNRASAILHRVERRLPPAVANPIARAACAMVLASHVGPTGSTSRFAARSRSGPTKACLLRRSLSIGPCRLNSCAVVVTLSARAGRISNCCGRWYTLPPAAHRVAWARRTGRNACRRAGVAACLRVR